MGWSRRSATISLFFAMSEQQREVGRRIARIREQRGLTQEDLAHASRVTVKTLSRLENGHHEARSSTIKQVAEALGLEPHDITGRILPPPVDETQLDRIEAKLDLLLSRLLPEVEDPAEGFEQELAADDSPSGRRAGNNA